MDQLETLEFAVNELRRVVTALDETEMDTVTNCEPWTVRRLASHALNNQLLWAGMVTGQHTVSAEDTMGAVPYDRPLTPIADDAADRALAMWRTEGVLAGMHKTPFGELPGSVVILFPTVDALAHAWDISSTLGRAVEFPPETIPTISAVFEATCTDAARDHGLIRPATEPPAGATDTERVMATSGRTIHR
ncbi:MAG: TIGR03086 family metal-binding protein [Acidimicrobiales bacterium]